MIRRLSEEELDRHDELLKEGWELVEHDLYCGGARVDGPPGWFARRRLTKALGRFHHALALNTRSWQCMWSLGKIHQRLGNADLALEWFGQAYRLCPRDPDVAREAGLAALEANHAKAALIYCRTAVECEPDDPGLRTNLALAQVLAGEIDEARASIHAAMRESPDDPVSRRIHRIVTQVQAGTREPPRTMKEIRSA